MMKLNKSVKNIRKKLSKVYRDKKKQELQNVKKEQV